MAEDVVKKEENNQKSNDHIKSNSKESNNERSERSERGERYNQRQSPMQRVPRFRKKVCRFCKNKDLKLDYKKAELLERFLTERGKILPRRITGTCAKHQRRLAIEVKRARMIALLPFVEQ